MAESAGGRQDPKKLGVEDNAEDLFKFWMAACDNLADGGIVRDMTSSSAALIDWLIDDLGAQPVDEWEMCGGGNGLGDAGRG